MNISMISFTENGMKLSRKIAADMKAEQSLLYTKYFAEQPEEGEIFVQYVKESVQEWARAQMEAGNPMLFIGACGIAVRAIAPYLTDKLHDSPVMVMDELGNYIIPILAGHVGGANEIAQNIAAMTGAVPVITTATDINKKFAVDLFAKKNALHIVNKDGIAGVSAKVLQGKEITISVDPAHITKLPPVSEKIRLTGYPPECEVDVLITAQKTKYRALLSLQPKEYAVGVGCKRGKEPEKVRRLIQSCLKEAGIGVEQVFELASVEQKREEECFLSWSREERIPFHTYTAEELAEVQGDFNGSEFVKEKIGVDNVCERAALKACASGGRLIYPKHAEDGMTVAIAKRDWRIAFD